VVGMERKLSNVKTGNTKLRVNLARFSTENAVPAASAWVVGSKVLQAKVVDGRSYSNAARNDIDPGIPMGKELVPLEVWPSKPVMEELSTAFVGFLKFPMGAKSIQTSLFMGGWKGIKVVEIGDNMVLISSEVVGEVERAQAADKKWWDGMFSGVRQWSPELVARRRCEDFGHSLTCLG